VRGLAEKLIVLLFGSGPVEIAVKREAFPRNKILHPFSFARCAYKFSAPCGALSFRGASSRELRIPLYKRRDRRLAHADREHIRHRQDVLINHQKPN